MIANYQRVTPATLHELASDRAAADRFFGYDIGDEDTDEEDEEYEAACDAFYEARRNSGRFLSIDKAWHGVQFLLTGNPSHNADDHEPRILADAILGGAVTDWEAVYGWVRVLTPERVRALSEALAPLSRDVLASRFDASSLTESHIYPIFPGEEWDDADRDWLLDAFDQLKTFVQIAATEGDAILLSLD